MSRNLYDPATPTTTPPDRASVARVVGADEADRLFGKDRIANALYGHTPAPPTAALYSIEANIGSDIDANVARRQPRERLSSADARAERTNFLSMIKRVGLDQDQGLVLRLHNRLTDSLLARERPGADSAERDTELSRTSETTFADLRSLWGPAAFDGRMARLRRFVEADPELSQAMGAGPGADFETLRELDEHLQRIGYR